MSDALRHSNVGASPAAAGYGLFFSQLLGDREQFFGEVVDGDRLGEKIGRATAVLVVLCAAYGAAAGAYAGVLQSVSSAIKLPVLFLATLLICFPAFFLVQVLMGSRLRLAQVFALVVAALALSAVVLAAFVPVTVFFLLTGANYYFLELLHVAIVLVAGLVGMAALHEGLAFACEKRGVYPRRAMAIMRVWALLFAFVGIQMAWKLRPFEGDRGEPFQVFRHYEGNFYTAVIYSVQKLAHGEDKTAAPERLMPLPGGWHALGSRGADTTAGPRH